MELDPFSYCGRTSTHNTHRKEDPHRIHSFNGWLLSWSTRHTCQRCDILSDVGYQERIVSHPFPVGNATQPGISVPNRFHLLDGIAAL